MQKILILGGTSHVGYSILSKIKNKERISVLNRNIEHYKAFEGVEQYSLSNQSLESVFEFCKPDIVVNCIGINDISVCEKNKNLSYELNVNFVERIISLNKIKKFKLIQFSSSHVYGECEYASELDVVNPLSEYGRQKFFSEEIIFKELDEYLVLRLGVVVKRRESFQRKLFLDIIREKIQKNESVFLVKDVFSSYVLIDDVVDIFIGLMEHAIGVYNVASDEIYSPYSLAKKYFKNYYKIIPVSKEEYCGSGSSVSSKKIISNLKLKKKLKYVFREIIESEA